MTTITNNRPHPRLSPDLNPVGQRVIYRRWDSVARAVSTVREEGIVEDYSADTIKTTAGPDVPKLVKLSGVWESNPWYDGEVKPPVYGLSLLYFRGDEFLGEVSQAEVACHSPALEIRTRLERGTLWRENSHEINKEVITEAQLQTLTLIVWRSWSAVGDDPPEQPTVQVGLIERK